MNVLTVNLLLNTVIFAIVARIYLFPHLPRLAPRTVLTPILLLHMTRHLGLMFLAPGAIYAGIPTQFTVPAAYGDFLAAILAGIALAALLMESGAARILVWIFNIAGTLDLALAIAEYNPQRRLLNDLMRDVPGGRGLGTFFWEPTQSGSWGQSMFTQQGNRLTARAADFAEYDQMRRDFGL